MGEFIKHFLEEFQLPLKNPVLIFSLVLFIILLSPILLRKLRIPGIIGLIISGVIIGPHGFGIIEKTSGVGLFSTIGLLYIMFIAGLDLDMNNFKTNRNKSLLFGFFTFIIPLAIGFPVCYYLLGYGFTASFLTASMFSTHTMVAYPIVSRLGVSKNQAVAVSVGGTILTDTAVLIMLAVILASNKGTLNQEFWLTMIASLIIFSFIMFFLIPRIAKWFFRKLESEKQSHYIFVLSVVFFAAFLAQVARLEPIIGAFVAGLALNKLIPHSSALMNRVEFIGNSLFIPFFLIGVGMVVDVSVILSGPTALIVAATLTATALLSKWIAALLTQLIFKFSRAQRQLIFGLSSAHAAATLAVILVGFDAGILDKNILNGTIILILITCIVASFATERAAKKLISSIEGSPADLDESGPVYNEHILLPISNVGNLEKLLDFSILIKDKKSANPVSILSIVSNDSDAEKNILKSRTRLQTFVKQASASETDVDILSTIDYNSASGIIRISKEIMADTIVLGWPKRLGLLDKLIGDKIESILTHTDKTIFICHFEKPMVFHKRIVIVLPPLAEYENGFVRWLSKISKLGQELSIPLKFYSNEATRKSIVKLLKKKGWKGYLADYPDDAWDDFDLLSDTIHIDDLLVLVSARKGAASYIHSLENLPDKLEKQFPTHNRIIIYPHQLNNDYAQEAYTNFTAEPLNKGIETVQKIGKGIGNMLKKGKSEDPG